ncbi:pyridoxamine 5'-phosphate oxidase family protein [Geminicoccaceae bacterium 1502E]|nr:pyridoxamine 5'-phosphate oxidase family protein [Geminicoccaceae bacterium 1502E]
MTDPMTPQALRALYGEPSDIARRKELDALDPHARAFIALSPFVVLASADGEGRLDATPRGDAPGFVAVLDERRLLVPDRRGNNRIDTLANVAVNPRIGMVFLVPGLNETLRVNGRARITTDAALLEPLAVQGRMPTSALLVEVEEVYFHCGKAMIRSSLWDPERQVAKGSFPSLGRIVADQIAGLDAGAAEERIEESYRTRLY